MLTLRFKDEIKSIKLFNKKYSEAITASMTKAKSLKAEIETLRKYSVGDDKLKTQDQIQENTDKQLLLIEKSSKMTDEIENDEDWESLNCRVWS